MNEPRSAEIIGYSSERKAGREDCRYIKALENKYMSVGTDKGKTFF
jgi:hypothetical protein